jgi:hypothetical protein
MVAAAWRREMPSGAFADKIATLLRRRGLIARACHWLN